MGKCTDFLSSLHRRGVKLWLDDGHLRYRASKGTLTGEDIAALHAMKDEVVDVLRHRQPALVGASVLTRREFVSTARLTLQQEWMWQALQRGSVSYLAASALRISGPLNPDLLRRSFEEIVRRHDSLHTRIVVVDGVPMQQFEKPRMYHLKTIDLSRVSEAEIPATVQGVIDEASHRGCDLAAGPLFDTKLLKLGECEHLLVFAVHHIVADGFSFNLMFREFWLSYREFARGRQSPLQKIPMQYADYAIWQQEMRRSRQQENDCYWKERLDGAVGIRWPVNAYAPEMKRDSYEIVPVSFGHASTNRLRELASQTGTTLATAVLTVYVAVLSRLCTQNDFVVAIVVTGRDRPELESMTGYCAHALYLRLQLTGSETFMDLLKLVSQEFFRALSHQDFGKAVAHTPDLLAHTLFQWIPWQIDGPAEVAKSKLDVTLEWFRSRTIVKEKDPFSQYDIMPVLWDTDQGVVGSVYCRPSALSTIERFARDLQSAAEQLGRNAYASVAPDSARPACDG